MENSHTSKMVGLFFSILDKKIIKERYKIRKLSKMVDKKQKKLKKSIAKK
jgi:hypothetical protein